jgi:hypothetical protein
MRSPRRRETTPLVEDVHRQHGARRGDDVSGATTMQAIPAWIGEYCGIQATGRRVSIALMGYFLFDKTTGHLNAERIYFDNNTILAQIRGEMRPEDVFDLGRIEQQ